MFYDYDTKICHQKKLNKWRKKYKQRTHEFWIHALKKGK